MLAGTHERQLYLILNIFNVHGAARGHATLECCHDLLGELCHCLMNAAAGRRCSPFYRQEGFGDSHGNLAVFKGDHGAVSFYDPELARCGCLKSCLLSYIGIRV